MKTKIYLTGLMIAVMALSSSIVYADNGGNFEGNGDFSKGGHEWHHGKHHMMVRVLNLTEDQQKQLKAIKQKQMETMKSIFKQMKSIREAFSAEIVKATPDMAKINDLQSQLKTVQSQMADNHLNSLLEIKKIMTPEQFAGFMTLKKEKELKGHQRHQFGHKGAWGKQGEEHKDWGNKGDKDQDND